MRTHISQDYVTIRGTGVTSITQSQNMWLDLPHVPNAVAWLDVKELTSAGGTVSMSYETAPSADEQLFFPIAGPITIVPFVPSLGVNVTPLLKDQLLIPLSRWFRWQLVASGTFTSSWDITFRLFLSTHRVGTSRKRK